MNHLVVRTVETTNRIHMDEIAVLLLESTAISITAYALCELVEKKVEVVFCDHKRNPCAFLWPSNGSCDTTAKIRQQMQWSTFAKEAVWTEVVRQKIKKQRDVLQSIGVPQAQLLTQYLGELQHNDSSNREGHSAKVYFNGLFGMDFTRSSSDPINAALNYGYTILLSAVNREIACHGHLTQLGIFHNNTFNPYNLGSDLMEPLRPLVDIAVLDMAPTKLEKEEKKRLINVLNAEVTVEGKTYYLMNGLSLYCQSVFRCLQSGSIDEMKLIEYEL